MAYSDYVKDGISTFTDNIHVQGMKQSEIYWEEVFREHSTTPYYNIWVRIEMSTADYMHAKAEAVKSLRDRFESDGNTEAKQKAEELLDELKEGVI